MRGLLAAALAGAALLAPGAAAAEESCRPVAKNDVVDVGYCSDGGCTDLCYVHLATYCRSDVTAVDKACYPLNQEIM